MALQFRFNALSGAFDLVDIAAAGAAAVPTFIAAADTWTIPIHTQALYAVTIDAEGVIDGDGVLIETD